MLKKISVMLVAGLFTASLAAGCKKDEASGGGCADLGAKAKADSMKNMPSDVSADMKKMASDMADKAAAMIVKHCTDDKWSADVVSCAKTAADPKSCMSKLTADQQQKLMDDMSKNMGGIAMPKDEPKVDTGSGAASASASGTGTASASGTGEASASGSGTASASGSGEASASGSGSASASGSDTAAASSGIPECDAYVAAMDKYLHCDKVPQAARDGAKQGLDAMKDAWGDKDMPEEAKKQAGESCKQATDALAQGAKAMGCEI